MIAPALFERFRRAIQLCVPLVTLVVTACGQPPCFEDQLHVEMRELVEGSSCVVHSWPGSQAFDVKDAGPLGLGISCERRYASFVNGAWGDPILGGMLGGGGVYTRERLALLDALSLEEEGCMQRTQAQLGMRTEFDDVASGIRAQEAGDDDAFRLRITYNAQENCSGRYPESPSGGTLACSDTYRVRITK